MKSQAGVQREVPLEAHQDRAEGLMGRKLLKGRRVGGGKRY